MPVYMFTGQNEEGQLVAGTVNALDKEAAMKVAVEKGFVVTSISRDGSRQQGIKERLKLLVNFVKGEDLLTFTQNLGVMLNAGLTLKRSLDILIEDTENPAMRRIILDMSSRLESGALLSESMARYPKVFSKVYVSMVASGEIGGFLPSILLRLATYIEKDENLKKKVKSAMFYPGLVLSFAAIFTFLLFAFGIPQVQLIYNGMGFQLPLPTRIFIAVGGFLSNAWPYLMGLLVVAFFVLRRLMRVEAFAFLIDSFKMNNPVLGPLYRRVAIARFCRSLNSLYLSQISVLQAMSLIAGSLDNRLLEMAIRNSLKSLKEGESFVNPLRKSKVFTQVAISMIAAGWETGKLDEMLGRLADFYEVQVEITLQALTGLLEPLIMVFVGLTIGVVLIVMALPFLQMSSMLMM